MFEHFKTWKMWTNGEASVRECNVKVHITYYFSLSDVVISLQTRDVAVAVTARMGVFGNKERSIPSWRYWTLKSWPHVLTQCASSMAISTIWFVKYNCLRNAGTLQTLCLCGNHFLTTYTVRNLRNRILEWDRPNCTFHWWFHCRHLYPTERSPEALPVC